ncbi:MAG: sigma-70 family RNA polymerase sigma factor [Nannocystaceae bacterium]
MSDRVLLHNWRDGDLHAGDLLVRRYTVALVGYFRARVAADAGDLAQQTLVACVQASHRVPDGVQFGAYLFGIARNMLRQHLRRSEVRRRVDPLLRASTPVSDPLPSACLLGRELRDEVADELGKLPVSLQVVARMYYWDELKISEISASLGLPLGTIKRRLHTMRRLLRSGLEAAA